MSHLRNPIGLLIALLLNSCATLPRAIDPEEAKQCEPQNRIYVASHGWHTGIILQPEHLNRFVPSLVERFPNADYYEIGWGDADYYQARETNIAITLDAIFLPGDSVVHMVGFQGDPFPYFSTSDVRQVHLTDKGMESLCAFLSSSFTKDASGMPLKLGRGLYGDSQFYAGEGKYHLFNGCNKWTAKALKSGGVDMEPMFKISSGSVMDEF